MTDVEVQVEVELASDSGPSEHHTEDRSGEESDCTEGHQNTRQGEVEEPLLAVPMAPPCVDPAACSCDCEAYSYGCEACSCVEVRGMEGFLQSMQVKFLILMSQADDLQDCLVNGQGHLDRDALAAALPSFLYTCQCYFNRLESTARSTDFQLTHLPFENYARPLQLLDLSQQLCDRLEQLVLSYASYNLVCLDETDPNSVSHFCIGQSQLGQLRLSTFLYCRPTPYLPRVETGLYKRMRWNVDRLRDEQQQQRTEEQGAESGKREAEAASNTEYYFLCYEDIPNAHAEATRDSQSVSHGNLVRMWSIGQWVQMNPDPNTEDIYDWITCEAPKASYDRLLLLGSKEPSSCSATDLLQQLLLSRQTAEQC